MPLNDLISVFVCNDKFCEFSVETHIDGDFSDYVYWINGKNVGRASAIAPRFIIFGNIFWVRVNPRWKVNCANHSTNIRVFFGEAIAETVAEFDLSTDRDRYAYFAVDWTIALILWELFADEDSDLF